MSASTCDRIGVEARRRRAVDHAMVPATATAAGSGAAGTPCRPRPACVRAAADAEDRDLGRVDDRREIACRRCRRATRSRSSRPACRPGPSLPSRAFVGELAHLLGDLQDALLVGVPDHRHDQAVRACRRRSRCGSTSSARGCRRRAMALKSGNFFSAATQALIRNASIVTLTPDFSFSLLSATRNASRSVMSASS